MRKVSCDQKASPEETFRAQLPVWLSLCPSARYVSLRRSSSSARFRWLISATRISCVRCSSSCFSRRADPAHEVDRLLNNIREHERVESALREKQDELHRTQETLGDDISQRQRAAE